LESLRLHFQAMLHFWVSHYYLTSKIF
jgi:hypothetical protein